MEFLNQIIGFLLIGLMARFMGTMMVFHTILKQKGVKK